MDIRLCPGIDTLLAVVAAMCSFYASLSGPLRPNVTSSIKPEMHNVSQRRPRWTEPWPQRICTQNFMKISPVVPEICSQTDRHTDRQTHRHTDHNTPHPYWGAVISMVAVTVANKRATGRLNLVNLDQIFLTYSLSVIRLKWATSFTASLICTLPRSVSTVVANKWEGELMLL